MGSVWGKHPIIRTRNLNLYTQIQYDRLELRDHIDSGGIKTDRHLDDGAVILFGDARDALLSGGINTWNVGWTGGHVGFDNQQAQLFNAGDCKNARPILQMEYESIPSAKSDAK